MQTERKRMDNLLEMVYVCLWHRNRSRPYSSQSRRIISQAHCVVQHPLATQHHVEQMNLCIGLPCHAYKSTPSSEMIFYICRLYYCMSLYGVSVYAHLIQFSVHVKNQDKFRISMALHFIFRRFYSPDEISWRVKHIYIQSYVVLL